MNPQPQSASSEFRVSSSESTRNPEPGTRNPELLKEDDDESGVDLEEFFARDPMLAECMRQIALKRHQLEALLAQRVANAVGRAVRTENVRSVDGMGAPVRAMPAFAWHDIAQQMGGYECFSDKSFNRYLDRKAPETKVKAVGTKMQVGWREHSQIEVPFARMTEPRFAKSYGSAGASPHQPPDPGPQTPEPVPC